MMFVVGEYMAMRVCVVYVCCVVLCIRNVVMETDKLDLLKKIRHREIKVSMWGGGFLVSFGQTAGVSSLTIFRGSVLRTPCVGG